MCGWVGVYDERAIVERPSRSNKSSWKRRSHVSRIASRSTKCLLRAFAVRVGHLAQRKPAKNCLARPCRAPRERVSKSLLCDHNLNQSVASPLS